MKSWSKSQYLTTRGTVPLVGSQSSPPFSFQQALPDAGNYTVQFRVSAQTAIDGSNSLGNITPTARIQWSIGGNTVQRIISVYDGASLTGVGDHVRVDLYDETDPADVPSGYEQKYLVAVTVSEGERGTNKQPPTYTTYIVDNENIHFGLAYVTSGNYVTVKVPKDAGVISVFVTAYGHVPGVSMHPEMAVKEYGPLGPDLKAPPLRLLPPVPIVLTEAQVSVTHLTGDNSILRQYDPRDYDWVPVPPQCDYIALNNTDTDSTSIITFAVTFGIDG